MRLLLRRHRRFFSLQSRLCLDNFIIEDGNFRTLFLREITGLLNGLVQGIGRFNMELFVFVEFQLVRREVALQDRLACIKLSLRQGDFCLQARDLLVARADGVLSLELFRDTVGFVLFKHHAEILDDAGVRGDLCVTRSDSRLRFRSERFELLFDPRCFKLQLGIHCV